MVVSYTIYGSTGVARTDRIMAGVAIIDRIVTADV